MKQEYSGEGKAKAGRVPFRQEDPNSSSSNAESMKADATITGIKKIVDNCASPLY